MRTVWLKSLVACVVSLVFSLRVDAQPLSSRTESIESTVANADLVLVARLLELGDAKRADGREVHEATIAIEETLKQDIYSDAPQGRLRVNLPHRAPVLEDWRQRGCRLVVALDTDAPRATVVIDLSPDNTQVMTADFKLLRDSEAVIQAAKEALRRLPTSVKRIHTFDLRVPRELVADTTWDRYYNTGGHLRLSVPVDAKLEQRARKNLGSEDFRTRGEAARALRYFKSDDNAARLKALLDDPGRSYRYGGERNRTKMWFYNVRYQAYETLKSWGVDVERPVIEEVARE